MKVLKETWLRFITPAFLSGANQNEPEIRAPSIRGAVRWWFRVLGGTAEQEREVFGGVHGGAMASKLVVRVSEVNVKQGGSIEFRPMSDKGYLYYFAKASGSKDGIHRTEQGHYVAEGSECKLSFMLRSEPSEVTSQLLVKAIDAFLLLGALGLRATRGCGCFTVGDPITRDELAERIGALSEKIMVRVIAEESPYPTAMKCQETLGGFLRMLRKDNHLSGKSRSALGFSEGKARESSALKLRPIEIKGSFLPVVIYTDMACGQPSCWEVVERATKAIG